MKSRLPARRAANRTEAGRKSGLASAQASSSAGAPAPSPPPPAPFLSKRVILACLVLIAASVAVYAPVRHFDFVSWDDPDYVTDNVHVAQGVSWQGAWWALNSTDAANWHPLTWLSHMLDVQLYGMNPGPHHVTSLLLHILDALLLFGILYRITLAWGRSLFVAALFAVHPLHVESVAWIAERKDVLSALFWMLTMWAYAAYVRRPGWRRYLLVIASFALGLMAKPMLVTLPFVLLLLDFWPLARLHGWRGLARLTKEKLPLFALAAVSGVVTVLVQRHGGAVAGFETVPLGLRLANAPAAYLAYAAKMLWPGRLAAFYPLGSSAPVGAALLGVLFLIGTTVLAFRSRRRYGYFATGWLWFVGTLAPVIGLVQVGKQSMADRYTYIPLIGLFLVIAWGAPDLAARWRCGRFLPAAAVCVLLACAAVARGQVRYWSGSAALWQRALDVTANNDVAHNNLGNVLMNQGRTGDAIRHFAEALRIDPAYAEARNNLGAALMSQGELDPAIAQFAQAIQTGPRYADARDNLGMALMSEGKLDEAARQFAEALRIKPDSATAQNNLGMVLARQGKRDQAAQHFAEALRLKPGYTGAQNNLGVAFMWHGQFDRAARLFEEVLRSRPDDVSARTNLGKALMRQGKLDEAAAQFSQVLRLRPDSAEAQDQLGAVLMAQGKFEQAAERFTEALRLMPSLADASANLKLALAAQAKAAAR